MTIAHWEEFEKAVASFVKALTPNAAVRHNVRLPDKHTGQPRQRDVWVEAVVGMFPVKILINCKRLKRKINQQDMDAFIGELGSSGAHKGVIYAFSGFTDPAITKAKQKGISCCKLYQNSPAELPDSLIFLFYCCGQSCRISWASPTPDYWGAKKFDDVFLIKNRLDDSRTVPETLLSTFAEGEEKAVRDAANEGHFPANWTNSVKISRLDQNEASHLIISLEGKWRIYRAKLEAHLLEGSYSFTENVFAGSQTYPSIDMRSVHPGPGWELITNPPDRLQPGVGMAILQGADIKSSICEHLSGKKLSEMSASKVT